MGRFARIVGKLEFKIKDEEIVLVPKIGDNRKLLKIMDNTNLNEAMKMDKLFDFIVELMTNAYPEEDKEEISKAVEFNFNEFMKEVLIAFGWTTKEKWDKFQGDAEKKLMSGN